MIGNKKAVKALLREIIVWQEARGFPLKFATEASIDLAEDEELLRFCRKFLRWSRSVREAGIVYAANE